MKTTLKILAVLLVLTALAAGGFYFTTGHLPGWVLPAPPAAPVPALAEAPAPVELPPPVLTGERSEERRVGNGDWSSDVCSSDLDPGEVLRRGHEDDVEDPGGAAGPDRPRGGGLLLHHGSSAGLGPARAAGRAGPGAGRGPGSRRAAAAGPDRREIGRAACRER